MNQDNRGDTFLNGFVTAVCIGIITYFFVGFLSDWLYSNGKIGALFSNNMKAYTSIFAMSIPMMLFYFQHRDNSIRGGSVAIGFAAITYVLMIYFGVIYV